MEFFLLLFLLVMIIVVGTLRLMFRVADRAGKLGTTIVSGSRGLFGSGGTPDEILNRLVKRHPGLTLRGSDGLSFTCSGRRGRLDFISNWTEIRFELDGVVSESLEVSTPGFLAQVAEDDPDAFRVRGSRKLYEELFKNPALAAMLRWWTVPFELRVRPEEFTLQLRAQPLYDEELWRWLKGAFALLQALPGVGVEDLSVLARPTPAALSESLCQVCGSTMGQPPVVYCRRCRTPHHEECWVYAGRCSTFACQEREFAR